MIAYPIGTMCGMFDFHYSLFGQEKIYTAASCGVLTHSGINFEKILSVNKKVIQSEYDRTGNVTEPFLRDIVSRFSYFYARQGQPDLDTDKLMRGLNLKSRSDMQKKWEEENRSRTTPPFK